MSLTTFQIGMSASKRSLSGTDRYYFSLVRSLAELGVNVRGVVIGDPAELRDSISGIESFAPFAANRLTRWLGLRRATRGLLGDASVVVSHNAAHAFPVLDLIRSRPLVVHFHGPWASEARTQGRSPWTVMTRRAQERSVYANARRFVVLSHAVREVLERRYGVAPERVRVIPGGVDLEHFRPMYGRSDARARLDWPLDRRIVVAATRLVPGKGIGNLIDAIDRVRLWYADVLLIVVGTGPLADELRARVAALRLERWVRFTGHLTDELPLAYGAADLSIVPSDSFEGFGLTVLESLACGTPVLVTPRGGLPEAVSGLDPALVLAGTTADDIAGGIRDAFAGALPLPDAAACVRYARRFAWRTIAASVRDVYDESTGG